MEQYSCLASLKRYSLLFCFNRAKHLSLILIHSQITHQGTILNHWGTGILFKACSEINSYKYQKMSPSIIIINKYAVHWGISVDPRVPSRLSKRNKMENRKEISILFSAFFQQKNQRFFASQLQGQRTREHVPKGSEVTSNGASRASF